MFYRDGDVYRALSQTAFEQWKLLERSTFFPRLIAEGRIVATEAVPSDCDPVSGQGRWVAALRHQRIPFVSYPYEWSFGMLRDAALLQLEVLGGALEEGFCLKDASSYNVQWRGTDPVFIDIGSFRELEAGQSWEGYLQFCQLFLYPLLLTAYRNVAFQPWLRGAINGIDPEECWSLMSWRDLFRAGVVADVYLQARFKRFAADGYDSVRSDLRHVGFDREMIQHNVRRLRRIVAGLKWKQSRSEWSNYETRSIYNDRELEEKRAFVGKVLGSASSWRLVWDLGCNLGSFAELAAEGSDYVVAMDSDPLVVERLYRRLEAKGCRNVLPLLCNLSDPSPDRGWRGRERLALTSRPRPDLVLCLALIHHLVIGDNVPLDELVSWLADLGGHLIIEFVTKDDPMVKRLLRNKADNYWDYEPDHFRSCLEAHFEVLDELVTSETRFLLFARPRSS